MNTEVIDFKDIFSLIFRKLWLIFLFAVCGGIIAYCVSTYIISPKYEAHINLYVQDDSPLLTSGNTDSAGENRSDVNNLKQLINTYIEVLNDDLVMQEVGNDLITKFGVDNIRNVFKLDRDNNIHADDLRETIFIESVPDTLVLKLKVITKDPEVSLAICNFFALHSDIYLQKAIGTGSKAQYMSWAKFNDVPVSPNKLKNTALGIISAVLLSLLLIFLMDFFDDSVRKADTLTNRYDRTVIGEVEHFRGKQKSGEKKSEYVSLFDRNIPLTVVENYRAIRTSLIYTLSSSDKKVISVSSAEPYEGKSVTAANLAISLAQGGNKVLLIDADLRHPAQHEIFSISEKKGLSNALTDISELEISIKKTILDKLDVLSAGPAVPNPSELVASENMDRLLEKLEDRYNYIVIDTPAVNLFTDAVEIAKKSSGLLMVARYNESSTSDIDSAISRIEFFEANMFGFILNDMKTNKKYKKFVKPTRTVTELSSRTDAQKNTKGSSYSSDNRNKNRRKGR